MRMLCVVSGDWVRGWKGRAEGSDFTPAPFLNIQMLKVKKCSSEVFQTTHCTRIYIHLRNVLQAVWLARNDATSEFCSCTTEWSFLSERQGSNTIIVCMCVHSPWCSSVGVLMESTTVLSTRPLGDPPSTSCSMLHGSKCMIWTSENYPRTLLELIPLSVYVLCAYKLERKETRLNSLPLVCSKLLLEERV